MQKLSKEIDFKNLIYHFKTLSISSINFIKFKGLLILLNKIENCNTSSKKKAEEEQDDFRLDLREIMSGNPKYKEDYQVDTIKNVKNLYNSRQKVIDLFNDNARIKSKAIHRTKQDETKGTGSKILTTKQMLQRLPIALAQVKAGSDSERLLNEISQIAYSLYQSKEITKKVYSNIIKSIQL